jgi:hypothetical protein
VFGFCGLGNALIEVRNIASFEPWQIENSLKNASYPAISGVKSHSSGEKTQDFSHLVAR